MDTFRWDTFFCFHQAFQVASLECMIFSLQLFYHFVYFWNLITKRIIFDVELHFLNSFGEHKLVLFEGLRFSPAIGHKVVKNDNNFLEVKLLKVDIHPSNQEVD